MGCLVTEKIFDWDKLEKISEFLSHFYDLTLVFSRTKSPIANLYFPGVLYHLFDFDRYKKDMATRMFKKFNKYWKSFSDILAIAVILDPCYKLSFVQWCYKEVYENDVICEIMCLKDKLYTLFNHYSKANMASRTGSQTSLPPERSHTQEGRDKQLSIKQKNVLKNFFYNKETTEQRSQLDQYLDKPRLQIDDLDVLSYWKANSYRYPEISAMARDVLAIPVSTVASKSAFSIGGKVLDSFRSALKDDTVEALICTRDWLFDKQVLSIDELNEDVVEMDDLVESLETVSTTTVASTSKSIQVD